MYRFSFGQSLADSNKTKKVSPTAYDVLACLQKYDVGTFKDFCDDFGYDAESEDEKKNLRIKATYKAVVNEYQSLCTLYSDAELEKLQEIN